MRPVVARDAALQARIDTLLFRFEQPDDEPMWGVDMDRGFAFDWAVVGGRWSGWGDDIRERLARQRLTAWPRTMPRFIQRDAVWSEDLTRVRLIRAVQPAAVLTPHGEWLEPKVSLLFPKTTRERKRNPTGGGWFAPSRRPTPRASPWRWTITSEGRGRVSSSRRSSLTEKTRATASRSRRAALV